MFIISNVYKADPLPLSPVSEVKGTLKHPGAEFRIPVVTAQARLW